jgi:hypothetical protein
MNPLLQNPFFLIITAGRTWLIEHLGATAKAFRDALSAAALRLGEVRVLRTEIARREAEHHAHEAEHEHRTIRLPLWAHVLLLVGLTLVEAVLLYVAAQGLELSDLETKLTAAGLTIASTALAWWWAALLARAHGRGDELLKSATARGLGALTVLFMAACFWCRLSYFRSAQSAGLFFFGSPLAAATVLSIVSLVVFVLSVLLFWFGDWEGHRLRRLIGRLKQQAANLEKRAARSTEVASRLRGALEAGILEAKNTVLHELAKADLISSGERVEPLLLVALGLMRDPASHELVVLRPGEEPPSDSAPAAGVPIPINPPQGPEEAAETEREAA